MEKTEASGVSRTRSCAALECGTLAQWRAEPRVIDHGAIVLCRGGSATMRVDFNDWPLRRGAVIALFPDDVVLLCDASGDFSAEVLRYDRAMLREASLQLEHTVYSALRADRCRHDNPVVTDIITNMFALLRVYFAQDECACLDRLVLYQLKAFFTGFYDWMERDSANRPPEQGSRRTRELFNRFMQALAEHYRHARDVTFYARRLNITPKYLNTIVRRTTQQTAKEVIDQYVVLQLKLLLRSGTMSIKQIAWDYDFSDTSFLCRYFKQHAGLSPQQYRVANAERAT